MKAQAAMEYVMIIGFLLLIMVPIIGYTLQGQSTIIYINQADDAVNTIANAVDGVYSLGPGTKDYVWVTLPVNVISSSLTNKEVLLVIEIKGKNSDIVTKTKAAMAGTIPAEAGTYKIGIEALDSGVVQVTY